MNKTAKMPYLKTVQVDNVDAINSDGELYTAQKTVQIVIEEDKGFMLMCNYMFGLINGIDSIVDVKVMTYIAQNLVFNQNTVTLNKHTKIQIQESTGYSISAIERSIGVLVGKEYLIRDNKCKRCGMYNVNPAYIWHGDREKRSGKLKMVLELQQWYKMPDKEREIQEDIKRAADNYKKQSTRNPE